MTLQEYKYWFLRTYGHENYGQAGCGGPILTGIVMILLLFLLCGCKTQYIPVETIRTEYKTKTDTFIQKDSVHVKDSVFIHSKGDTVWYEKWHTKYVDRWNKRVVCDTLIKTDSIHVPYPVPAQLSRWQSFCCDYGKLMLGGTIMALILITTYLIRIIRKRAGGS